MPRISSHLPAASWALALAVAGAMSFHGAPRAETLQDTASAKAMLGNVVEYLAELVSSSVEGSRLQLAAVPSARPSGNKVEMIFPAPSILGPHGGGIHLGDVSATVTPQEKDNFEFSVGLPKSLALLESGGKTEGRISWSESAMRGTWRADLDIATAFHGALYKVLFTDPRQDEKHPFGKIDSVTLDQELVESANGWWSGPFSFAVANLEFNSPVDEEQIFLEKISLRGDLRDFDLAAWQALSEWGGTITIAGDGGEANPLGDGPEAARIFESMNLGAGNMDLQIADLRYGPPGTEQFKLGGLSFGASYDNDARPGAYSIAIAWQGLDQGDNDLPEAFFTHSGSLNLHLERFPIRQMLTLALRETALIDSSDVDANGDAFQAIALPLIEANQTGLRLEDLVLHSSVASLAASGKLSVQTESALGVVGEAHVEIAGLDRLFAAAARQALKGEETPLALLTVAKGLGKPEIGADGEVVYVFNILLPPDGVVTINEIPLDLLQDSGVTALPGARTGSVAASAQTPRS